MKFTAVFTFLIAVIATTVVARETNAQRFARGLPPLAPVRRAPTPADSAEMHHPSGMPHDDGHHDDDGHGKCSTGPVQCCNSVSNASNPVVKTIAGLVNAELPAANVPVGLGCSPLSAIGVGGHSCSAQTVCCDNNEFKGVIAIGCIPININA